MRKIAVLTESRADYGIYLPVLKAIQACPDLELNLIVTGMHLSPEYGKTWQEIERDGFKFHIGEGDYDMTDEEEVGNLIEKSDWLIVLGDRMPMLRACLVAAELGIPIAHIQGGDVTTGACIDESIRHAITRFAHLHFPSQRSSARRLIRWGEESWRVKVVGPLGIYNLEIPSLQSENDMPTVFIIQHPTKDVDKASTQMLITLNAVISIEDIEIFIFYPNSDSGSEQMIKVIQASPEWVIKFPNLPYQVFQGLLARASVLVGNSSVALHEAPLYGIPVVNIGDRELGREMWGKVINVPHDFQKIKEAIEQCLKEGRYKPIKRKFIDGPAIIVKALRDTPIDDKLLRKGYA
jgi:GDP/UDP-N,N'-diacetylbacillosamine 2-epimerase (hydrolysing)